MVILSVGEQDVVALDPLSGERTLPLRVFDSAWTMALNLTILVDATSPGHPNFDQATGTTTVVPTVSKAQGQAEASLFLSDHLPDRISASVPRLDESAQVWRVPVILAYPNLGVLGQVGEIVVSAVKEEILSHTPVEEMRKAAWEIIEKHRDAIEAPLP